MGFFNLFPKISTKNTMQMVIDSHDIDSGRNKEVRIAMKHNLSAAPTSDMVDNNLRGIAFEKCGDISSAIKLYEYNIQHRFEGNHPYDRLAIIYRKQKQYDKEIFILESAIDVFTHDVPYSRPDRFKKLSNFKESLKKVKELKKKQH